MGRVEELLEPIAGDHAAGPDLSDGDEYAAIERAYREADVQPSVSPGGGVVEPDTDFSDVVDLATAFLRDRSKDLKIAALLAAALLREEGFAGLAEGLELLRRLMEERWDGLHPGVAGRSAVLAWLGSDEVAYAVYLGRFTEMGHTYHHYREWARREAESDGEEAPEDTPGELSAGNFEEGFAQTTRTWYDELCSSLEHAAGALEALNSVGRERFPEADERPLSFKDLAGALKRVTAGAQDLLDRKPAPPPSERMEPSDPQTSAEPESGGKEAVATAAASVEPRSAEEAAAAITAAARVLRQARPHDPAAYLLLRGFRWGELRAMGERLDPRRLVPPRTEQRTRLKTMFLDRAWANLLEAAEEIMATPVGRAWLDLQRYTVLAAERQGSDYRRVAASVKSAVGALLVDVPSLVRATLMDDSATASPDTVAWLQGQGLVEGDGTADSPGRSDADVESEEIVLQGSFERAADLARGGDPHGAVELLMSRAEHERSERARFLVKAEAAGILVRHGMEEVARPILDELHERIEAHSLEDWESGDVVARPLGLLYRCLAETDGSLRQQLYTRLAKLDPLLAMEVREDGGRTGPEGAESGSGAQEGQGGAGAGQGAAVG